MAISAGVYRGVRVTGSPGIKDDLVNAGAVWEDAAVVVDRHFISSRKPDDLPDFMRAILAFAAGNKSRCRNRRGLRAIVGLDVRRSERRDCPRHSDAVFG